MASVLGAVIRRLNGEPSTSNQRYRELFDEFVLSSADPNQDDLLFFVRDSPPSASPLLASSSSGSLSTAFSKNKPPPVANNDIIFVKRRTPQHTVTLSPDEEDHVRWKETLYLNLLVQLHCELTVAVCTKSTSATGQSSMNVQRHVTKRVYASPSKTRMDKKGHEYSYSFPLIFFNVEDFEEAFANVTINSGEYLCVELRVQLPKEDNAVTDRSVTIFQGAVSWDAISSTFVKQSSNKAMWERVEYIMMRGPKAKGHCQVAVAIADDDQPGQSAGRQSPGSVSGSLRNFVRMAQIVVMDKTSALKQLKCSLTFVNVTWQSIVNDVSAAVLGTKDASPVEET